MWTTPCGPLCRGTLFLTLLLAGCRSDRPAGGPEPRVDSPPAAAEPADALAIPSGMNAIRFREEPAEGARVSFTKADEPNRVDLRVTTAEGRDSSTNALERWLLEPIVSDSPGRDTVFVAVRRLAASQEPHVGTDAAFVLLWRQKVVARVDHPVRLIPGTGLAPRRTIRTRTIRAGSRAVVCVRSDSAGVAGSERYRFFGFGPAGTLQQFTGPTEHFRDADLPATLNAGQVVYARVRIAWFSVPLPLTFEPGRARFVPEVGDDAMFSATGKATFRGDPRGSSLIRLFASPDPGASSVSLPIPPLSEAVARKAFLPFLVPGHPHDPGADAGMVFVTIGSLEGWLPDSLIGRFTP